MVLAYIQLLCYYYYYYYINIHTHHYYYDIRYIQVHEAACSEV